MECSVTPTLFSRRCTIHRSRCRHHCWSKIYHSLDYNADHPNQIKYANKYRLPFLAVNRGHGTSIDLNKLHHGISIYVRSLDSIAIAADGKSATLGGGVYADQLIKTLAIVGKTAGKCSTRPINGMPQTPSDPCVPATGSCTCVGVVGAGLGGGFGRHQGLYGLVTDNFIEMTVVTADGSITTVNDHQNPDLFWAMRGAGHNFGIVTKFKYRIYDSIPSWYIASYQYTKDKLDAVFTALNDLNDNGKQPKELTTYTVFAFNPSVSNEVRIAQSNFRTV